MVNRFFIELSYDGSDFHGWQIQPNAKTIQETLNGALSTLLREEIYCVGCGRTDTGVHAKHFIAHFDTTHAIDEPATLSYKCNRMLPKNIAVQSIKSVAPDAHARFSATARTYEYLITQQKDPFAVNRKWEMREALNVNLMNEAAGALIGEHDFSSFSKSNTQTETNLCEVKFARWDREDHTLRFVIKANRFLRNMVRAIVGTLIEVGKGNTSIEEFEDIINSKNRSNAGTSVPAQGLYLTHIEYPPELLIHAR